MDLGNLIYNCYFGIDSLQRDLKVYFNVYNYFEPKKMGCYGLLDCNSHYLYLFHAICVYLLLVHNHFLHVLMDYCIDLKVS